MPLLTTLNRLSQWIGGYVLLGLFLCGTAEVALAQGGAKQEAPRKKVPAKGKKKSQPAELGEIDPGALCPQFLGTDRDNRSPDVDLLRKWPSAGPKYLGAIRGLGVGFSSFSSADGVLYTLGNIDDRERVLAVSLADGAMLWSRDLAAAYKNSFGDGPRCTPTLDGDRLYAVGATGELVCLNRSDGEEIWRRNIVREFRSEVPQWGICESVLIDGDRLICTPGGPGALLAALDKSTGETVWQGAVPGNDRAGYASILPIEVGGVRQYVQFTHDGVVGIRAQDGGFLWRDDSSANGTANCAAAVFSEGMVFTASNYGKGASMVELDSDGETTSAKFRYHTNDLKVHHGGLVLHEGHVYGSNDPGVLTCIELKTGKKKWANRSVGKACLTFADGKLYVRGETEGKVALVNASPASYQELGRLQQPQRSNSPAWTYPVVFSGRLYLRDQDEMHVYQLRAAGK